MKRLLRLNQIIGPLEKRVPIGKSAWWQGVRDGKFPKPVKLSPRCTCWRESDIDALVESFGQPTPSKAA